MVQWGGKKPWNALFIKSKEEYDVMDLLIYKTKSYIFDYE